MIHIEVIEVLSQKINSEGWQDKNGKSPIDFSKSEEMTYFLEALLKHFSVFFS